MAELHSQLHNEFPARVLVGEGRPESLNTPDMKKADSLYNKHMQEIFDVVAPEAVAERVEAAQAQSEIAAETAKLLSEKSSAWQRFQDHKDLKRFVSELDTEWRGRELPHRMERVLLFSVLGGVSSAMDYAADSLALRTFLTHKGPVNIGKKTLFTLDEKNGNREALKAGWEMMTDELVGAFSDKSLQLATNRKDATFISPLSDSLAKIGNIVSAFAVGQENRQAIRLANSIINPSTIEAGFRTLSTIPLGGAVIERMYSALNTIIGKEHSLIPLGFDVSVAMIAAKTKRVNEVNKKKT